MRWLVLIWALVLLPISHAVAEQRIGVARATGEGAGELEATVIDVLRRDFDVRSPKQVAAAMDDLHIDSVAEEPEARQVAKELGVTALVTIKVKVLPGGGHRGDIGIVWRDRGKRARSFRVLYGSRASDSQLRRKLDGAFGILLSDSSNGAEVASGPSRAPLRVELGPSMTARSLSFQAADFTNRPKGYSNTPVPGVRAQLEVYPLAFGRTSPWLGGIGVGADFDQTVSAFVNVGCPDVKKALPVSQRHYGVDGRYRFVLGRKPTSPTLTVGGGIMGRQFIVDRSKLESTDCKLDMPDVNYFAISPSLGFRFWITDLLAMSVGGRWHFPLDTGPIQSKEEYGQAVVYAFDSFLGLEFQLTKRMWVRLAGDLFFAGYTFKGSAEQTNNRDMEADQDVFGARDLYWGGAATVGFSL